MGIYRTRDWRNQSQYSLADHPEFYSGNWLGPLANRANPSRKLLTFVEYEFSCGQFHADSLPQAGPDYYPSDAGMFFEAGTVSPVGRLPFPGQRSTVW